MAVSIKIEKRELRTLTGNEAIAEAMRQVNPDVMAAYPITPSTPVVEKFAKFVADGVVDTELVTTESEHSAMSACVGAAAAGGRVMTATGAVGLAFMFEVIYVASSLRLPIVVAIANRALNSPLSIHGDHSDTMAARDSGWIQLYSENPQECYDNLIQAVRIAEHPKVRTPVMVCFDGFQTSHMIENLYVEPDELAKGFIGEYKPVYPLLDYEHPVTYGAWDRPDYLMEHKRHQVEGLYTALEMIKEVGADYEKLTGRKYGLIETYKLEDAELGIVVMSATASTVKYVVNKLREQGIKAGLLRIRAFRPFPVSEVTEKLASLKSVAVLDRSWTGGALGGPLFHEVCSALYNLDKRPKVINYIYGIGGRELYPEHIEQVYHDLVKIARTGKIDRLIGYLNLRE
jgi:pyruvate ferredoxin oxidoreductase alpha subunit